MLSQAYTTNDKVQKLQLQLSDFILKNKKSKEKTTSLISDFESLIYEINNH